MAQRPHQLFGRTGSQPDRHAPNSTAQPATAWITPVFARALWGARSARRYVLRPGFETPDWGYSGCQP